jgi:hypothetical protein
MPSGVWSVISLQQADTHVYRYLVGVDLELHPQCRVRNVVDQVCGAHATPTANVETPATIRIVWVANGTRRGIHNQSQVGEISNCGRGNRRGDENDATEEHGGEQQ